MVSFIWEGLTPAPTWSPCGFSPKNKQMFTECQFQVHNHRVKSLLSWSLQTAGEEVWWNKKKCKRALRLRPCYLFVLDTHFYLLLKHACDIGEKLVTFYKRGNRAGAGHWPEATQIESDPGSIQRNQAALYEQIPHPPSFSRFLKMLSFPMFRNDT